MLVAAGLGVTGASAQIVALGASNTEGYGVGKSSAYPAVLEDMLRARGRNVTVINAGIYGNSSGELLERMDRDVPNGTRVVILSVLGQNDLRKGGSLQEARANAGRIRAKLAARGIQVLMAHTYTYEAIRAGHVQRDRIHLDAEGHQYVAAKLLPQVIKLRF